MSKSNPNKEKFQWLPLAALSFAYGSMYNPPYMKYFLYDSMIAAMDITNVQLSLLMTVSTVLGIIISVPGGWVADRFSTKKIMIIGLLGNFPLILLSVLFVKVYWLQLFVWAMFAFTGGFAFWPAVLKGIRVIGGKEHQSTTYGVFESGQGLFATLGNMIALGIFAKFTDQIFGYKAAFLSTAVYCIIGAVFIGIFYKDDRKEATLEDIKEVIAEETKEPQFKIRDTLIVLKNPGTWLISVSIFAVYGLYGAQTYMTPYFTGVLGAAITFTGFFAIFRDYGMKVLGGPVGGIIGKKISAALLNAICLVVYAILVMIISGFKPGSAHVIGFCVFFVLANSFVCCLAKSTMWATMDESNIPLHLTGTAISIISVIGINLPDAVLPVINGWFLDTFADNLPKAYRYYFTLLITIALVGAVAAIITFIRHRRRLRKEQEQLSQTAVNEG